MRAHARRAVPRAGRPYDADSLRRPLPPPLLLLRLPCCRGSLPPPFKAAPLRQQSLPATALLQALLDQFRRVANAYFLFIAALSCLPVSPVSPITNFGPLALVVAVRTRCQLPLQAARRCPDPAAGGTPQRSAAGAGPPRLSHQSQLLLRARGGGGGA